MKRFRPVIWLVVLCLWGLGEAQAGSATSDCPLAWGVALEGGPITLAQIQASQEQTGLAPRLVVFFLQWPAPGQTQEFPLASLDAISQAGATPCLTWEPMHQDQQGREVMARWQDILTGAYDPYLTAFAQSARAWKRPIIVRLAHEMNLSRYHWGTNPSGYGPESPGIYQRIHHHVVDICRRQGALNLRWAFCPNAESNPHPRWHGATWNTAGAYYPGADYVDIMGMDGYNWGVSQTKAHQGWDSRWQSFADIFGQLRNELRALAPAKPLVIFETASVNQGGDRMKWAGQSARVASQWGLRGLVWFQVDKEEDWRLLRGRDDQGLAELGRAVDCPRDARLNWLESPAQESPSERR